jgi:hypothetical protein
MSIQSFAGRDHPLVVRLSTFGESPCPFEKWVLDTEAYPLPVTSCRMNLLTAALFEGWNSYYLAIL